MTMQPQLQLPQNPTFYSNSGPQSYPPPVRPRETFRSSISKFSPYVSKSISEVANLAIKLRDNPLLQFQSISEAANQVPSAHSPAAPLTPKPALTPDSVITKSTELPTPAAHLDPENDPKAQVVVQEHPTTTQKDELEQTLKRLNENHNFVHEYKGKIFYSDLPEGVIDRKLDEIIQDLTTITNCNELPSCYEGAQIVTINDKAYRMSFKAATISLKAALKASTESYHIYKVNIIECYKTQNPEPSPQSSTPKREIVTFTSSSYSTSSVISPGR